MCFFWPMHLVIYFKSQIIQIASSQVVISVIQILRVRVLHGILLLYALLALFLVQVQVPVPVLVLVSGSGGQGPGPRRRRSEAKRRRREHSSPEGPGTGWWRRWSSSRSRCREHPSPHTRPGSSWETLESTPKQSPSSQRPPRYPQISFATFSRLHCKDFSTTSLLEGHCDTDIMFKYFHPFWIWAELMWGQVGGANYLNFHFLLFSDPWTNKSI